MSPESRMILILIFGTLALFVVFTLL